MATSALPAALRALVTLSTAALAASDVLVVAGVTITDDPGDFLMIGVDDPTASTPVVASAEQVPGPMGTSRPRDENASITCAAEAFNGEGDVLAAIDAACEYMAAVEDLVRADPTLGFADPQLMTAQFGGSTSLIAGSDEFGSRALVVFTITYRARI